ncbi:MAG: hypothetical protein ACYDA9_14385 [Terriglobia bacterium]
MYFLVLILAVGLTKASSNVIFDEKADAKKKVPAAIVMASPEHQNVVPNFDADWCEVCHVLEAQKEKPSSPR